jgi:nucleoside-diphosphate-sugar epimerase
MKVLVTGAAGQVGCRLVRQLLERNHEVVGTILPDDPCRERLDGLEVELVEGDLTDGDFVKRSVRGVDAVIHTANLVGPYFENNVKTNLEVSRACGERADSLDRLIYVSSSGVFPNNGEVIACAYHPVDELHPKRPDSEYSLSKLIGEELVEMASRRTGLRTVIVRPSHVLSGGAILKQFTVERVCSVLKAGQRNRRSELYMSDGTELWRQVEASARSEDQPCSVRDLEGRPWYYQPNDARDVAGCLTCALEAPGAVGESFNVGAPLPFTFPEGAQLLSQITGQEVLDIRLPVRWRYDHDITKAKSWIGFQPRGDLKTMMASAKAVVAGEHQDYAWDGGILDKSD